MILVLLLLLQNPDGAKRADFDNIWNDANERYQAGKFQEAASQYEILLEEDIHNGKLHFNIANAYFKQGILGRAILHYCKARKYLPGDKDVIENLKLADSQREDLIEDEDTAFLVGYDSLLRRLDYQMVFFLAAGLICLAGILLLLRILRNEMGRWLNYAIVFAAVWGLLFGIAASLQYGQLTRQDMAVLVADIADVRAGPATTETVSFTIHEGVRCRILDSTDGWYRIALANGYNGWVPARSVAII